MLKRIILIFSLFAIGVVLFSVYQAGKIEKEPNGLRPGLMKEEEKASAGPAVLVPSLPQDYGMLVNDDNNKPGTQEEWDSVFRDKINELKSRFGPGAWDKVNARIQEEPQKTEEKIKQIDSVIRKCGEALKEDPDNQEARDRLERLMMLKSIAKELRQEK